MPSPFATRGFAGQPMKSPRFPTAKRTPEIERRIKLLVDASVERMKRNAERRAAKLSDALVAARTKRTAEETSEEEVPAKKEKLEMVEEADKAKKLELIEEAEKADSVSDAIAAIEDILDAVDETQEL